MEDKVTEHSTVNRERYILIVEQPTQATEIAYVVDTNTGEMIGVYGHDRDHDGKPKPERGFKRDSRKLSGQRKKQAELDRWRENRRINSIKDVRCKKDIEALNGDHPSYTGRMSNQGIELLHSSRFRLSTRAKDLASMLILKHLVVMNYCLVSNDEIKNLIGDRSGNYTKYLKELETVNFCEVQDISKTEKLITINPAYGYRGPTDPKFGVSLSGVSKYYQRQQARRRDRKIYEDGWLEVA